MSERKAKSLEGCRANLEPHCRGAKRRARSWSHPPHWHGAGLVVGVPGEPGAGHAGLLIGAFAFDRSTWLPDRPPPARQPRLRRVMAKLGMRHCGAVARLGRQPLVLDHWRLDGALPVGSQGRIRPTTGSVLHFPDKGTPNPDATFCGIMAALLVRGGNSVCLRTERPGDVLASLGLVRRRLWPSRRDRRTGQPPARVWELPWSPWSKESTSSWGHLMLSPITIVDGRGTLARTGSRGPSLSRQQGAGHQLRPGAGGAGPPWRWTGRRWWCSAVPPTACFSFQPVTSACTLLIYEGALRGCFMAMEAAARRAETACGAKCSPAPCSIGGRWRDPAHHEKDPERVAFFSLPCYP